MKLCNKNSFYILSLLFLFNSSIHGLLIPEEKKTKYINQKLDPLVTFAKKKFSEFLHNDDIREKELKNKEKECEKRFSTWSYTRSLKYLKKNEEFQKTFYQSSSSDTNQKTRRTNTKKHYPEENKYKRYALNPESLLKGFPRYISEDFNEAFKKRSSKRNFDDDPLLSEMYQNKSNSFFDDDFTESYHFNMYPKNINLEHNIVKVSIPYKNRKDQRTRRYLIRGDELSSRESLKEAKAFPLIDYDYENYLNTHKKRNVRYLKPKSKNNTTTEESVTSNRKRSLTDNSEKDMAALDLGDEKDSFIFYYFCDDDDEKCEKALRVFEHAGERIIKLIDFKYTLYVYIYYYSFCNHNPSCHSTVMGSAAPSFFYTINKTSDNDNDENIDDDNNNNYNYYNNNDDLIDSDRREYTDNAVKNKVKKRNTISKKNTIKNKSRNENKKKSTKKQNDSSFKSGFHDTSSDNMTTIFINPFLNYKNTESLINQQYSPFNISGFQNNHHQNAENQEKDEVEVEEEEEEEEMESFAEEESTKLAIDFKTREQEEIKVGNNENLDSDYSYPSALIKQLTGIETESDIMVLFNSDFSWDYDETERGKKYNLEQTVLHEFLHGLGFLSSWYNWFNVDDTILIPADITLSNSGDYGIMEKPYIFNKYIAHHAENEWVSSYQKKISDDFSHFPEFPFKSQLYRYFKESASYDVAKKVYKIMTTPEAVTFWCAAPYNLTSSMQHSESLVRPTLKKVKNKKRFKMYKPSKTQSTTKSTSSAPEKTSFMGDYINHYNEYQYEIDDFDNNVEEEEKEEEKEEEEEIIVKKSKLYTNWLVLYTPTTFYTGTSLSHFDSSRYRKTKNYIMRPYMDPSTSISYSEEEYNNYYGISDDILCVLRTLGYTLNTDVGK